MANSTSHGGLPPLPRQPDLPTIDYQVCLQEGSPFTIVLDRDTTDDIAGEVKAGRVPNQYLVFLLNLLSKPGDRVLDLGAHFGTFSVTASALGRKVLAVDANTKHVELLHRSREANRFTDLHIAYTAVGDKVGTCQFYEEGLYGRVWPEGMARVQSDALVTVPLTTAGRLLRAIGWDHIDFLKMDIEGSEVRAVRGLDEFLAGDNGPAIVYESNAPALELYGETMAALKEMFERLGYTIYRLFGEMLVPVGLTRFLPEAWLDLVALKPRHQAAVAANIQPQLTTGQLAQQIREWWAPRDSKKHREFVARELEHAEPELRAHPLVIESMELLVADVDPDVRAAAAWHMPNYKTGDRMHEIATRLRTVAELARVGGDAAGSVAGRSLISRAMSRMQYLAAALFTARQKRFNVEVASILKSLSECVGEMRQAAARPGSVAPGMSTSTLDELQTALASLDHHVRAVVGSQVEDLAHRTVDASRQITTLNQAAAGRYFRTGTTDRDAWHAVNEHNEYRLPDCFAPTDVVIDVGAHVGSFSNACLARGAGWVWSFEASWANWAHARTNLARFGERVIVHNKAVWRSDGVREQLFFASSPDPANTGGGWVLGAGGMPVDTIPLDDVIDDLLRVSGAKRVRLLKLDCEGSEFPILLTSHRLHLIDEVLGEYHEELSPPPHGQVGDHAFSKEVLSHHLKENGFEVELCPSSYDRLGLFFASRRREAALKLAS